MNNLLNKISFEAKKVQLSSAEKSRVRNNLVNFIDKNPVRNTNDGRLQYTKAVKSPFNNLFLLLTNYKIMPLALIALLFVGGGVSFAAQGSLPGDVLYPIKVNINEKVETVLNVSSEAKAGLEVRLAERRLEEAEKLTSREDLNEETKEEIKARFDEHASRADQRITAMIETNPSVALDVVSRFETSLKAHESVLAKLDTKTEADATRTASATIALKAEVEELPKDGLLDVVRVHAFQAEAVRMNLESQFAEEGFSPKTDNEQSASGMMQSAINVRAEVRKFIEAKVPDVNNEIRIKVEAQMKLSDDAFAVGKTQLELKSYNQAFVSFQKSIRLAQEAKSVVTLSQGLYKDVKPVTPPVSILPIDLPEPKPEKPIEKPVPTPRPNPGIPDELGNYFASKIEAELSALGYVFIEGPTPESLIKHFVKFELKDFNGVQAFGGTYYLDGQQLVFKKLDKDITSSNDKAVSRKGYLTLLTNSSTRLNVKITDKSSVDGFVRILSGIKALIENPLIELR